MNENYTSPNNKPAESTFDSLAKERNLAEYAKDQIIYSGLFVDPDNLYSHFPPSLSHKIRDPHVTTAYRPDIEKLLLDSLGSGATIRAVGYGNDGKNEGLLVEVLAEDPAIQKALEERFVPDKKGEVKVVPTHITLSIADNAKAVDTKDLDFSPLDEPIDLTGTYEFFGKNGALISNKTELIELQASNTSLAEVTDPDRP